MQGRVAFPCLASKDSLWYDKAKKHGANWKQLFHNYAKCLNKEKHEEVGWKSTFEISFGSKSNELVNAGVKYDGKIITGNINKPTKMDLLKNEHRNLGGKMTRSLLAGLIYEWKATLPKRYLTNCIKKV